MAGTASLSELMRATISAPRSACSRMTAASAGLSGSGFVRIESGIPIFPMSWKRQAFASVPRRFVGRESSRPIASPTRRTRCEWPAVYGSRASTAAFSVSIVSMRLCLELARRLQQLPRVVLQVAVLARQPQRSAAHEERDREPDDEEDRSDRQPDRGAHRLDVRVDRVGTRPDLSDRDGPARVREERSPDDERARPSSGRADELALRLAGAKGRADLTWRARLLMPRRREQKPVAA